MRGWFLSVGAEQRCPECGVSRLSRSMIEEMVLIEIKSVALDYFLS